MIKKELKKCPICGEPLQPLNPPVEDYVDCIFCIKIFGLKLILTRDKIEYGCIGCMTEEAQARQRDMYDKIYDDGFTKGYEKGMREGGKYGY